MTCVSYMFGLQYNIWPQTYSNYYNLMSYLNIPLQCLPSSHFSNSLHSSEKALCYVLECCSGDLCPFNQRRFSINVRQFIIKVGFRSELCAGSFASSNPTLATVWISRFFTGTLSCWNRFGILNASLSLGRP